MLLLVLVVIGGILDFQSLLAVTTSMQKRLCSFLVNIVSENFTDLCFWSQWFNSLWFVCTSPHYLSVTTSGLPIISSLISCLYLSFLKMHFKYLLQFRIIWGHFNSQYWFSPQDSQGATYFWDSSTSPFIFENPIKFSEIWLKYLPHSGVRKIKTIKSHLWKKYWNFFSQFKE